MALNRSRFRSIALIAALGLPAAGALPAQDWVEYVDESATRIVADPEVGTADVDEKDIVFGDVDRDGDADLIIVRKEQFYGEEGRTNVLFLNQRGVMTDRTDLVPSFSDPTLDRDATLADVNGDGWLDIITATTLDEEPRIYINRGRGLDFVWDGFSYEPDRIPTLSPPPNFCAVGAGDVTEDGHPDLFFADYGALDDVLLVNDGTGFYADETALRMDPEMSMSGFGTDSHILDVNGDGYNDVVKDNPPYARILYWNPSLDRFDFMDTVSSAAIYMLEPGDFTGDGKPDLFLVSDGQDLYLTNDGNDAAGHAQFTTQTVTFSPRTASFSGNVKLHDLNLDGRLDAIVSDIDTQFEVFPERFALLRGRGELPAIAYTDPLNGDGTGRPWLQEAVYDADAFDVNYDCIPDLWVGSAVGNRLYTGTVPPIFSDLLEDGAPGWTTTGQWHLADDIACGGGYSSPTHAFYYGDDVTCRYSGFTSGALTSPEIDGVTNVSTLAFDHFFDANSGEFGQVQIVHETGIDTLLTFFGGGIAVPFWERIEDIDLSPYAGQTIQVRFVFAATAAGSGRIGWLIDDVTVTGKAPSFCECKRPPIIIIVLPPDTPIEPSPIDGIDWQVPANTAITLAAKVEDARDGDLTDGLQWSSSNDESLASGGSMTTTLPPGIHTLEAWVIDICGIIVRERRVIEVQLTPGSETF